MRALLLASRLPATCGPILFTWEAAAEGAPNRRSMTQDVRRFVTGSWLWTHPFSGRHFNLDARWRILSEYLSLDFFFFDQVRSGRARTRFGDFFLRDFNIGDGLLRRHREPLGGVPLPGQDVTLLPSGAPAFSGQVV